VALEKALRAEAEQRRVDEAQDFGDHFASNRIKRGRTSTGGGEFFMKIILRLCQRIKNLLFSHPV
jgi:hypothetical protein